jgi:hypothetical protein
MWPDGVHCGWICLANAPVTPTPSNLLRHDSQHPFLRFPLIDSSSQVVFPSPSFFTLQSRVSGLLSLFVLQHARPTGPDESRLDQVVSLKVHDPLRFAYPCYTVYNRREP